MKPLRGKPLHGRLILDCSALFPGPRLGKLLVGLGARVLKIESPARPDPGREHRELYDDLNEDKELVLLDFSLAKDQKKFHALVKKAHGLIEGFRPKAKKKLGLDSKSLHAINPKLCIASIVGYPETGPLRDRPGHDLNFEAVTGMLSTFDGMPGIPLADHFGAYQGALGLVAAMDAVSRGGKRAKGTRVVIPLIEALCDVQSGLIRVYRTHGKSPEPGTNLFSGLYPCYRLYSDQEGRKIAVGAIETKFWERICEILGLENLKGQGYATGPRGREVVHAVQAAFASKPWSQWAPAFEAAECCVDPVLSYPEIYGV